MQRTVMMSFLVACLVLVTMPALARAEDKAAERFAAGQALLAKADFDGALKAFKVVAKTDTENQEYAQQYAMLRQVVRMRRDCPKEQDAERWLRMAGALRTFYHDHQLYSEALPLDEERHRRQRSAESAVLLAKTQFELGMYSQAIETLGSLTEEQTSPQTRVLHGLVLARLGQFDEAKKIAEAPGHVTDDAGPLFFYDLARLRALVGDSKEAFPALTRSFELTPPSQLDAFRAEVRRSKDFSTLVSAADFAKVLETSSKVKESNCSKGPGCGRCPRRANCGGKSTKDEKTEP